MGLIVKKDFNIGYDIESYMRIYEISYLAKKNEWSCAIQFYLNENSINIKKIIEYFKSWIIDNPTKVNDRVLKYLNDNYLSKDNNLYPIDQIVITLNNNLISNISAFKDKESIFKEIYKVIKKTPTLINAKEIISDTLESTISLIQPILLQIEELK